MKQEDVSPTVLSADGPGVPYRRRAVGCLSERYLAGVRWALRSGCGQPLYPFRSNRTDRRGGRGWDTTMVVRRAWAVVVATVSAYLALVLVIPSRLV